MKKLLFLLLFLPCIVLGQGKLSYVDTIKVEALCSVEQYNNTVYFIDKYLHKSDVSEDGVFKARLLQIQQHKYMYDPQYKNATVSIKVLGYLWPDKTKLNSQVSIWQVEQIYNKK